MLWKKILIIFLIPVFLGTIILFFQTKRIPTQVKGEKISSAIIPTAIPTDTPVPTVTPAPVITPAPTKIPSPTPYPIIIVSKDLDDLFSKYSSEYNVDKELLKRIANCESSLNPNAVTKNYAGLFQFAQPIWISTRNLMGLNSDAGLRLSAEESIRTAAYLINQGHLGLWPNCGKFR
jgi:hypothetical protein